MGRAPAPDLPTDLREVHVATIAILDRVGVLFLRHAGVLEADPTLRERVAHARTLLLVAADLTAPPPEPP